MKRLLLTFTMTIISFNAYAMKRENPYITTQQEKNYRTLITPNNTEYITRMSNGTITVTTPDISINNAAAIIVDLKNNRQPYITVTLPKPTIIITPSPRSTTNSKPKFNKNYLYPQRRK